MANMKALFRGFLPVVVDVETGGFNANTDALLEIAIVLLTLDDNKYMVREETIAHHVTPFTGANIEAESLAVTGIKPDHPFRFAVSELQALTDIFKRVNKALKQQQCQRAVLVGHNAAFDLSFLQAAILRNHIKKHPFHAFTTFDTATLSAVAYGQTVLARAVTAAGLEFDINQAHSAIYDAEKTADLFCTIFNKWRQSG